MKVLQIVSTMSIRTGGPAVAVKGMAKALARKGHKVDIYTTDYDEDKKGYRSQKLDGYTIHYFPTKFLKFYYSPELKRALLDSIKNFDIVHTHGLWVYPTMIAARMCQRFGMPYIIRPCGMLETWSYHQKFMRKLIYSALIERKNLKRASLIHFTSERERSSHIGIKSPQIVVPLGIDEEEFIFAKPEGTFKESSLVFKGKRFILFFGRIHYKKGLDLLIRAFKKLAREFVDLWLVVMGPGDPKFVKEMEDLLEKEDLVNRTIMLGLVCGKRRFEVVRDAEFVCLPSRQENFGMVLIEALACGTPVITSAQVDLSEDIKRQDIGLVTLCEVDSIYRACRTLLSDRQLRDKMATKAKNWALRNYRWDNIIARLEGLYYEVLRRNRVRQ